MSSVLAPEWEAFSVNWNSLVNVCIPMKPTDETEVIATAVPLIATSVPGIATG